MDASFAIDVVESGYRVVQGADAWALGVLAAARGALDDGLGLQLFVLQATPGDAFTAELTQNLGGPASVVDFSLRALTSYPPPFVRMLLEDVGRFGSSSEFIRASCRSRRALRCRPRWSAPAWSTACRRRSPTA
ncbi:MAG: hypothetical protein U1F43_32600 [Myxococcota bacterium]